jgi:hypothetical protein
LSDAARLLILPVMTPPSLDPRLLRLHADDNVVTLIAPIAAGERLLIEGETVTTAAALALGHKLATRAIAAGEKIVKYGAPIGSAKCAIARGEHVHMHNVKSDYLPTLGS